MPFMLLVNQRMARPSCNEQGSSTVTLGARITKWIPTLLYTVIGHQSSLFFVMGYSVKIKRYEILPVFQDKLSDSTRMF